MKDNKLAEFLLAGGIAGVVSRTVIAPIERVKIIYQIRRCHASGVQAGGDAWADIAPRIVREEGVLGLWKGNTPAVIRVIPYMAVQFSAYEYFKMFLEHTGSASGLALSLSAGAFAGMTAVATTYPLDVVRARMAMQAESGSEVKVRYNGFTHAMRTIMRQDGVRALYRGMGITIAGVAPYTGMKFASYELFKNMMLKPLGYKRKEDLPWYLRMGAGAFAGLCAQTLIYPVDVARRRMQTHSGPDVLYKNPLHALRTIARTEGISTGLYRGMSLNLPKTLLNVAIYMSLYDYIKNTWMS